MFFNALDLTQLHAWLSHLGTIEDVVVDGSYFSLVILLVLLFVYVYQFLLMSFVLSLWLLS